MRINSNFLNLYESYLFAEVEKRVSAYQREHPNRDIIRLSIGDVEGPLFPAVIREMQKAVEEMGDVSRFRGYGPEKSAYAYPFFSEAVKSHYQKLGVKVDEDEIFLSDGAKGDLSLISSLFARENCVLLISPVYPAYLDINILAGRKINYILATPQNDFLPTPRGDEEGDIVYLCSPNNPTGAVYDREKLETWVEFCRKRGAVLLFDAAYESYVSGNFPHSIFEVEGARECAIEICSFSKSALFTGLRCGYTVVPKELKREGASLNKLFFRLKTTAENGVSYVTQRGAAAAFSPEGEEEIKRSAARYIHNARRIGEMLSQKNIPFWGGENSPYIWMKCRDGYSNWQFFDFLLKSANVVGTPGSGFGKGGEGYFRLSAFGPEARICEAVERLKKTL